MSFRSLFYPTFFLAALLISTPAFAEPEDEEDIPGVDTWALHVGAAFVTQPEFIGADEDEFRVFPFLRAYYRLDENNEFYFNGNRGGYNHKFNDHWKVGVGLTGTRGRNNDEDSRLAGLEDVPGSLEVGPWVQYRINDTKFRTMVRYDVSGGHNGYSVDFELKQKIKVKPGIHFNGYVETSWADNDFMDTFFTVAPGQAIAGRPAFNAGSGFYKSAVGASFNYGLRKDVFVVVNGKVQKLHGDASDSPLAFNSTHFIGYVGLGYTF
ncbi:MAG: hypothetical protein CMF62_09910 [Magnetococcales bacterium]|nr:hypothetical protein [Magnetococcales bacterium]|tara:strand:- start:309435 stop:310232 length:798 start_codon:yes stop_codon:yes gene_type:complete